MLVPLRRGCAAHVRPDVHGADRGICINTIFGSNEVDHCHRSHTPASQAYGHPDHVKPVTPEQSHRHGSNFEMPWVNQPNAGQTVPVRQLLIRNHASTPTIGVGSWRPRSEGTGVGQSLELSYDQN